MTDAPSSLIERLILHETVSGRHEDQSADPYEPMRQDDAYDCCWFCGHARDVFPWMSNQSVQHHAPDCPWMEAMDLLGHPHPDHEYPEAE